MPTSTQRDLLPPDEKYWQRYSPHHEMPLSGMTSLVVHGLVIGVLVLVSMRLTLFRQSDNLRPPSMDVVQLEGGGDGLEGLGGDPGQGGKTEIAQLNPGTPTEAVPANPMPFSEPAAFELQVPPSLDPATSSEQPDLFAELARIEKEAAVQAQEPVVPKKVETPKPAVKMPGTGSQKGTGGLGGKGDGPGKGNKAGPGTGTGGLPGRGATQQEIFARRWRFDLTGQPKEHAEKLAAMGIILGVPDLQGARVAVIQDLKRRPVETRWEDFSKWKDAVRWYNTKPESVNGLTRELRPRLSFTPQAYILMLPKEREEKMAQEENRFAQTQGRNPLQITETWFDFRLQNGAYEPVAIAQK